MLDALKTLFENDVVSEQVRQEIEEAWEAKVKENRLAATAELREEFAQKYEHDKQTMVEAVDALVSERLASELAEFAEDRKSLAEAKAKYAVKMRENAKTVKKFVSETLAQEIKELHEDQRVMAENFAKLEDFVVEQLAKEINEFSEDKKDLAETKVRLVREAKSHLGKVKKDFIERSAKTISETVDKALRSEITQLKEDIDLARQNDFGRKIFEAFANEYGNSYLNEKSETAKLLNLVKVKDKQMAEAKKLAEKAHEMTQKVAKEKKQLEESVRRSNKINDLIAPLSRDQKEIMVDLLESVQTDKLQHQFDRYLPAVIDGKAPGKQKAVLAEAKEVTGNRENTNVSSKADDNLIEFKRLAGLN